MRQTLFYIPKEIAGLDVFGPGGLLFWAWAVASVVLLAVLIKRQGFNADTRGYIPVLLLIGAAIAWLLPRMTLEQGLPIRGYGMMMLLGILAAVALAARRARRMGVDPEVIYTLAFWLFVAGIVGARTFYVVQKWPQFQRETLPATLGEILSLTQGGLVVYGSAIGGGIALAVFIRLRRIPALALTDLIAPSLMLALAIGRVGCFLNGCCYGGACELPWAVRFPAGSPPYARQYEQGQIYGAYGFKVTGGRDESPVVADVEPGSPAEEHGLKAGDRIERINDREVGSVLGAMRILEAPVEPGEAVSVQTGRGLVRWEMPDAPARSLPVHPTQLYSAASALLVCLVLLAWYPFRRRDGEVTALLLTLYPITRFVLEMIRTDELAVLGTQMSISQNVSLLLLAFAVALWAYVLVRPRGSALPPRSAAVAG